VGRRHNPPRLEVGDAEALVSSMDSPTARLTRQSGTSFYYAFQILPEAKRRAIYALYSFCRAVDDCVDEEGGGGEAGLQRWFDEVARCYGITRERIRQIEARGLVKLRQPVRSQRLAGFAEDEAEA